jgi:hypothetical protein
MNDTKVPRNCPGKHPDRDLITVAINDEEIARMEGRRPVMLNLKIWTWSLGTFAAVVYVLCVLYGLIVPDAFHWAEGLEGVLPGFRWLTLGTFFLGLIESFLYGIFGGLLLVPIHNLFYRRWGTAHGHAGR